MAEREPAVGDKRDASGRSLIQPSPGTQKLAVFCHSGSRNNMGGFQFYVFNLDMKSIKADRSGYSEINPEGGYSEINPKISYEGDKEWGGCVLNATLYLFNKFTMKLNYDDDFEYEGAKSVMKFDLSSDFLESKEEMKGLDKFVKLAPMRWHKCSPVAIPTPNGEKILVIDQVIGDDEEYRHETCFELYDPSLNLWTPVAPPEFPYREGGFYIEAYTFIDESCLLLSTEDGNFLLDLNPEKKKDGSIVAKSIPWFECLHALKIDEGVAISPGLAFRPGSNVDDIEFELSSPPPERIYESLCPIEPSIILWNHIKGCHVDTLIAQIHLILKGDRCYLTVDACRTDVVTLKTKILGTLKYLIRNEGSVADIHMFVFEPLPLAYVL